jgi:CHAD domain-containing protein
MESDVKTDRHLEVERKYDVPASFALPSFDSIAQVARAVELDEVLDARYFDTADLRLARAGVTLRRRTGGGDEGWHLKLPDESGARLELRRPLGRSARAVPAALADLVLARTRGEPLVPVACVHTQRHVVRLLDAAGRNLAELADDDVRGEANDGRLTTWREVEAELVDGDRQLLDEIDAALRAHGAAVAGSESKLARVLGSGRERRPATTIDDDSTAGEVVTAYLARHVDTILSVDPAMREDLPDALHSMRVATRRLRSALRTYRPLYDRSSTDPIRAELKWLAATLGTARDAEVMRHHLIALLDQEPPDLVRGPVRRRITRTLRGSHTRAHAAARAELSGERYFKLLDALDGLSAGEGLIEQRAAAPARAEVARCVRRTLRRLRRVVDQLGADAQPGEAMHEARKLAKEVRYSAESAEPVVGAEATALARRMQRVQDVLGEQQDSDVSGDVLMRLAADAEADGEPTFTYGRLHAFEEVRGRRAVASFHRLLAEGIAARPPWLR